MSFRQGTLDGSGLHGMRDARLLPGRRLAVVTYGSSCPDRPMSVSGSGRIVTVVYRAAMASACLDYRLAYTAVFRLPGTIATGLPLSVTVRLPGAAPYTVAAR